MRLREEQRNNEEEEQEDQTPTSSRGRFFREGREVDRMPSKKGMGAEQ